MIVTDLGCADYGYQDSVAGLIAEYHPSTLYGFDPAPRLAERAYRQGRTKVVLNRMAAWLYDGEVPYHDAGTSSRIGEGDTMVPCFDLAKWLRPKLRRGVVLKMDIEGGEVPVLEHLVAEGLDSQLQELVVEWHGDNRVAVACPVRDWWM
jgi:FkbM family methyltransferase